MADGGTGEKTEEPTPERLRKLRKEGNVPKSQDITQAISFLGVFVTLAGTIGFMTGELMAMFRDAAYAASVLVETDSLVSTRIMGDAIWSMMKICAPALGAAFILGVGLNVAQVGLMFTTKPLTPDIKKLDPIKGFKNLFNQKKMVELLKTIIKFVVISYLSYLALRNAVRDVVMIVRGELLIGLRVIGSIIWDFTTKIGIVFIVLAAFDAMYQRYRFMADNRMSKYDIKQEFKQSEGDPQIKSERRRLHQELLNSSGSPQGGTVTATDKPD